MRSRLAAIGTPEIEEEIGDPLSVAGTPPPSHVEPRSRAVEQAAMAMLFTAVKALSQRAVIALGNLYALLLAASAFVLWWRVLPAPTVKQLVGLALYGCFVLAVMLARRGP